MTRTRVDWDLSMAQDQTSERPRHGDGESQSAARNPASGAVPKKPYTKPAFQFERAFETMALACGKVNQTQAQCRFNRKRS